MPNITKQMQEAPNSNPRAAQSKPTASPIPWLPWHPDGSVHGAEHMGTREAQCRPDTVQHPCAREPLRHLPTEVRGPQSSQ